MKFSSNSESRIVISQKVHFHSWKRTQFHRIQPLFKNLSLTNSHVYQRDVEKMFPGALCVLQKHRGTCQFPITVVTSDHTLRVLKHKSVLLQLWRSDVQNGSTGPLLPSLLPEATSLLGSWHIPSFTPSSAVSLCLCPHITLSDSDPPSSLL